MKKCMLFLILTFSVVFGFADVNQITEDYDFQIGFETALANNDFSEYENQLILVLEMENPKENQFAEAIFYVYFYNNLKYVDEKLEDSSLSDSVYKIKELINVNYQKNDYSSVVKFFKEKAKSSLMNKFNIGLGILSFPEANLNQQSELAYIENADAEKKSLFASISEVEAMYQRFAKMTQSNTSEELTAFRFSDEAFIKTTEKPSLVFVMKNEPDYKVLYDAYLEAGKNIKGISFGETQDAYYKLIDMLETLDLIAKDNALVLSNIFSNYTTSILRLYHTSPYVLTLLNLNQILVVINEIDFVIENSAFNSRIINLLKK